MSPSPDDRDTSRHQAPAVWSPDILYGPLGIGLDDPAETYHEASSFYPSFHGRETWGANVLSRSEALQETARRSVRRNLNRRTVTIPAHAVPDKALSELIEERASRRTFTGQPANPVDLASILYAGHGVRSSPSGQFFGRTVPSGGALYPLELFVAPENVHGMARGLYRYDPENHGLETISTDTCLPAFHEAVPTSAEFLDDTSFVVLVLGVFWRTRFKYGQRGYRFALLEAGHAMQNMLLCAEGLGLSVCPVGGFYDAPLNSLVMVDGVTEAVLYLACFGGRAH